MKKIEDLSIELLDSLKNYNLSNLSIAQICSRMGIKCFESNFQYGTCGYICEENNKITIKINNTLPNSQKEIVIASFLGIYTLYDIDYGNKIYLDNSDFKTFNKFYEFGLHLFFNKKIIDRKISQFDLDIIRQANNPIVKMNKIENISKKLDISFSHTFNYFNI